MRTSKKLTGIWKIVSALAVVAFAALGMGVASGAFASANHHRRVRFSVFSRHSLVQAHRASASQVSAPAGAVLADVNSADGRTNEVYAWHRSPGEDCIVDVEGGSEVTTACSPAAEADAKGVELAEKSATFTGINVLVMVPDDVITVTFTDGDGSTHSVGVTNNVVEYASSSIASASYVMPGGARQVDVFSALGHPPASPPNSQ